MKKHLLFLSLALGTMSAMADTAVFDFTGDEAYGMTLLSGNANTYNTDPYTCNEGDVTMTINGKSRWWDASSGPELRMYKESGFTIAVPDGYHVSAINLDAKLPGSFAGDGYVAPNWTGSLASVTINCTVTSGNTPIYKVTVTYAEGDATGEVTPTDPVVLWGKYALADDFSAGKYLLSNGEGRIATPNSGNYGYLSTVAVEAGDDATITTRNVNAFEFVATDGGFYIKDGNGRYLSQSAEYDTFNYSNAPVAGDDSYVWVVEFTAECYIYNSATDKAIYYTTDHSTFGAFAQMAESAAYPVLYKFVEDTDEPDTPEPPVADATSVTALSQVYALANNEKVSVEVALTVVYAYGPYVYVTDGTGYALIYKTDLGLNAADIVEAGWKGKVSVYNNLYELVPDAALTANGTGTVPEPQAVTADDAATVLTADNQNVYAVLKGVTFAEATPAADAEGDARTYAGTMGDATVTFYQRFGLDSVEAGTYDVTGFISVYKDTVQFQPTAFAPAAGIAGIAADTLPVVYYNMRGVRIANPTPGTPCIRVQGTHATKVIK